MALDIQLTRNSVCQLLDGSFVFAGTAGDVSSSGAPAMMICLSPTGEEVWRYEARSTTESKNAFYDVHALPDGSVRALLVIMHSNATDEYRIQTIRDGILMADATVVSRVSSIAPMDGGLLVCTTDGSTQTYGSPTLTLWNQEEYPVWQRRYDTAFSISEILVIEGGFYIIGTGYPDHPSRERFSQFIARFDNKGYMLWHHFEAVGASAYCDAASAKNGDIIAAGGIFEASDGSAWAKAQIACYAPDGTLKWINEQSFDEASFLWSAIETVEDGLVVAATNHIELGSVSAAHFSHDGTKLALWDEPFPAPQKMPSYIGRIHGDVNNVFLIVTV